MRRETTGRHEITAYAGERVQAYVPAPLPPAPPLELDGPLQSLLEQATLGLGRLDSLISLLPDTGVFLYTYVRKEAVLSSQIEGTQSSLSDLLLFELDQAPGVPFDDVVEVSNHVAALDHGLQRLREGFPLSNRLIREIHEILLARGRGATKDPGQFRRTQNWIGGTRPGTAHFVPPPPNLVQDCMGALESYLHESRGQSPVLLTAALAHVQFETIHPFLDGNGRVGRLLITLLLCDAGLLGEPLLYLSLFFKQHRAQYYDLLDVVRRTGDWEAWIEFFMTGVRETTANAVSAARDLEALFRADAARIQDQAGRRAGSALRVHRAFQERPLDTVPGIADRCGLSYPATSANVQVLVDLGILREITGKQRGRVYCYDRYLKALDGGLS